MSGHEWISGVKTPIDRHDSTDTQQPPTSTSRQLAFDPASVQSSTRVFQQRQQNYFPKSHVLDSSTALPSRRGLPIGHWVIPKRTEVYCWSLHFSVSLRSAHWIISPNAQPHFGSHLVSLDPLSRASLSELGVSILCTPYFRQRPECK